jgi:hypothetical protein
MQSPKYGHHFDGEIVRVEFRDVILNFIGTRPGEFAEWATARRLVSLPQVPP